MTPRLGSREPLAATTGSEGREPGAVLVVGASGTIGSAVVRGLVGRGTTVRTLVRDPERARHLPQPALRIVGDLAAPASLAPAFDGADRVFIVTSDPRREPAAVDAAARAGAQLVRELVLAELACAPTSKM